MLGFTPFMFQNQDSKVFNVNNNHPIIQNSQEYVYYKKYVSIHSEDRDILRFPSSNQFEIELPEDMNNIVSIRLANWTFPANYNTFALANSNITMTFKITKPYNPGEHEYSNPLQNEIFKCLFLSSDENYGILIEEGFYNPTQMIIELTNKFNHAVSKRIEAYLTKNNLTDLLNEFKANCGYTNFIIVYNNVSQKIWFGNNSDGFVLTNESILLSSTFENTVCGTSSHLPDFSNWGLPANIGLSRCNTGAISGSDIDDSIKNLDSINNVITPRFYYGDVTPGDNGYWLLPNPSLPGCEVFWIECPYKINLMGPSNIYMELDGQNCIDETSPYSISSFTIKTNETNGIYNSSFAKIPVPTTPISQWFDRESMPYKLYVPPAERIRKLKVKFRYHNGLLCNFGNFDYSFTLEFVMLVPQQLRNYRSVSATGATSIFK